METRKRLNDPELVAARRAWEQRLTALFRGDIPETPFYLRGISAGGETDMYENPAQRCREALEILEQHADALLDDAVFRPLCVDSALHGVHFIDKIFGANVYELDGEKGNWQAEYLPIPVGALEPPDLETNPTWRAAREFARAFVESGTTVPVFSLPTIASALNIGLNLYGQRLLLTMMSDPDAARHDLAVINEVLMQIHAWYRRNIPPDRLHQVVAHERYQPPGCGQICGCSNQLISGKQYETFIAGLDDAILSSYTNGGMIHLCGAHTQHIGSWRAMTSLKALQVNDRAAEDLDVYVREMPEKVYYVNPCSGMPVERVATLAKSRKIVICAEPQAPESRPENRRQSNPEETLP